jgi:hypothetical protein
MAMPRPALLLCLLAASCGSSSPGDTTDAADGTFEARDNGQIPLGAVCQDNAACAAELVCKPLGEGHICSRDCSTDDDCGEAWTCVDSLCAWSSACVGSPCSQAEPCHPGLECAGTGAQAYCTRSCDYDLPCPQGERALCVKLTNDQGQWCLRKCAAAADCAEGLACTPLASAPEFTVCFPTR